MAQKGFNGLSDDGKAKVEQAIQTFVELYGGTQNDWLEKAADLFMMEQMKEGNPEFVTELKELETLQSRVVRMVTNMVERVGIEKQEASTRHGEEVSKLRLQIEGLITETQEQKKTIKAHEEAAEKVEKDRAERNKYVHQLETAANNNAELIASQKEKIGHLGGLVAEYKSAFDERNGLKDQLTAAQDTISRLTRELKDEKENRAVLEKATEERHKSEIERITERKDLELEREVLRIRTELQTASQEAANQSTAEIRGMYDKIERLRNDHVTQMDALKAEYERQIAELKNPKK